MPCGQLRFEPACAGGNLVSEDIALPVGYYIPSAYSGPRYKKRWLNDSTPEARTWQGCLNPNILCYHWQIDRVTVTAATAVLLIVFSFSC
jgi:hypothetical protein